MSGPSSTMIFAAGRGTRMAPLTDQKPKPMIEVAGRPLIDHALALAEEVTLGTTLVNTHHLAEQIETYLSDHPDVVCLREEVLLETGGGLKNALPSLGTDPVFTINSDAVWTDDNPLMTLLKEWRPEEMDGLLVLIPKENAKGHKGKGDFFITGTGGLIRRGDADEAPYIYGGAQIIRTEGLNAISQTAFSLNLLWDKMLDEGRLFGVIHQGGWVDVGQPQSIPIAEALLAESSDV